MYISRRVLGDSKTLDLCGLNAVSQKRPNADQGRARDSVDGGGRVDEVRASRTRPRAAPPNARSKLGLG